MFKIFLTRHLQEEDSANRRNSERFAVQKQHILALGEGEILRLIDLSKSGFSAQVSERALNNLSTEKTYQAKLAYSKSMFEIKVAWKEQDKIGFELVNPSQEVISIFQEKVTPLEIAQSLRLINSEKNIEDAENRLWYQGVHDTDLIIWRSEDQKVSAWQITSSLGFIEWNHEGGIRTGSVSQKLTGQEELISDDTINRKMVQLANDIVLNSEAEGISDIIPTLSEEVWDLELEKETKQEK